MIPRLVTLERVNKRKGLLVDKKRAHFHAAFTSHSQANPHLESNIVRPVIALFIARLPLPLRCLLSLLWNRRAFLWLHARLGIDQHDMLFFTSGKR